MAVATGPEAGFFVGRGVSVGSGRGVFVDAGGGGVSVPAGCEIVLQASTMVVTITSVKRVSSFLFMCFFLFLLND